jgi:diguanylate cyclase (GGDEF)-like protein
MKKRVLLIGSDMDFIKLTSARLETEGYEAASAASPDEALAAISARIPDIILIDETMPGINGSGPKGSLSDSSLTAGIPVIFITEDFKPGERISGFKLGIDDYIAKPFEPAELAARIDSALNRKQFYEEISMTDGLTGLYNARFLKGQVRTLLSMAKRYKQIFSMAVIGVDRMDMINKDYGRAAGDSVLKHFASEARKSLRAADIVTRYGGDEFIAVLPGVNERQATSAMERLKSGVEGGRIACDCDGRHISFSVSVGIAEYNDSIGDEEELFRLAYERMQNEKRLKE